MKNSVKLSNQGIKALYYHETHPDGSHATVCLLTKEGHLLARGVALCSPKDSFSKRLGRNISCGRAIQAMEKGVSLYLVRSRTNWAMYLWNGLFKGTPNPALLPRESDIITKAYRIKVPA